MKRILRLSINTLSIFLRILQTELQSNPGPELSPKFLWSQKISRISPCPWSISWCDKLLRVTLNIVRIRVSLPALPTGIESMEGGSSKSDRGSLSQYMGEHGRVLKTVLKNTCEGVDLLLSLVIKIQFY